MTSDGSRGSTVPARRVLIVEDHSILTESLRLALRLEGMEPHVASGLDEGSVFDDARRLDVDVVLLDLHLTGGRSAVPMIGPLVAAGVRVLVLTGSADEGLQGAALHAGATAVLHKGQSLEQLCQGIHDVVDGHAAIRPARRDELLVHGRERMVLERRLASLSPRERDVLAALLEGVPAETIAELQFVSIGTIRTHIRAILRKLEVGSQLAAVAAAREAGWSAAATAAQ